jgi:hypothetical protein
MPLGRWAMFPRHPWTLAYDEDDDYEGEDEDEDDEEDEDQEDDEEVWQVDRYGSRQS